MCDKTYTFAAKPVNMLLKDFFSRFPNEESCISYFKEIRQTVGITCSKCGGKDHTWLNGRGEFQCKKCGCRTSLTKAVTDGGKSLFRLKELLKEHEAHQETDGGKHEVVVNVLPWVHIITGECRSGIEAIHKEIDERFLQLYLNEYCWKFNRRFFRDSKDPKYDLFDHLIKIAATYTSDIKWRDYAGTANAINIS